MAYNQILSFPENDYVSFNSDPQKIAKDKKIDTELRLVELLGLRDDWRPYTHVAVLNVKLPASAFILVFEDTVTAPVIILAPVKFLITPSLLIPVPPFEPGTIVLIAMAESATVDLEAKSALEILDINLQSLSEKLKLIGIDANKLSVDKISSKVNILSPIDGYVSKVNVNVGKYLSPNDILFELINPDDIHLNIQIKLNDLHIV